MTNTQKEYKHYEQAACRERKIVITEKEKIIEAIHTETLFDLLGSEGWPFEKDTLLRLSMELWYALMKSGEKRKIRYNILIEQLEDFWDMENGIES